MGLCLESGYQLEIPHPRILRWIKCLHGMETDVRLLAGAARGAVHQKPRTRASWTPLIYSSTGPVLIVQRKEAGALFALFVPPFEAPNHLRVFSHVVPDVLTVLFRSLRVGHVCFFKPLETAVLGLVARLIVQRCPLQKIPIARPQER